MNGEITLSTLSDYDRVGESLLADFANNRDIDVSEAITWLRKAFLAELATIKLKELIFRPKSEMGPRLGVLLLKSDSHFFGIFVH
jgi:hypothetical protein